jgi:two-component system sensor histidine kinase KdpD
VSRGTLRIYLGAAPGVGKTFAMLNEGSRRAERGTDVVVGVVETHGRPSTAAQIGTLEVVPRRAIEHRGATFDEMDVDAILTRHPAQALVDELAHTNVPGSRNEKRWQDIEELLEAGIDVISTVNIQHLESLNDVIEQITGTTQRETVPDAWVRQADQIELVDMTPEALRRRMAHGNIYPAERIDAALANYFRVGNLAALRELALLWVADRVDESLQEYRERHGIEDPWETRERVVVAVTGAPGSDHVIRRAARMAARAKAELVGAHVRNDDGTRGPSEALLAQHRELLESLGGRYVEIVSGNVAAALVAVARAENGTQLVLGASRRSRWAELVSVSVINDVIRRSGDIDVHVISPRSEDEPATDGLARSVVLSSARPRPTLPRRRMQVGWALAACGPPAITLALAQLREHLGLPSILMIFVLHVTVVAAIGGAGPAVVTAIAAFLLVNWYFTPPIYTWTIDDPENVLALVVFLVVALVVSWFVSTVARRSAEASRAAAEAEALARLAALSVADDPLPGVLDHLRASFGFGAVALLRRAGRGWHLEAAAGDAPPAQPEDADHIVPVAADVMLALRGDQLQAEDRHVLQAFAAQLAGALESRRLAAEASAASQLAEANELRTALLAAVSHDLRTPLASIKASVTSLLASDVTWSVEEVLEFCRTIDEETDRLTVLVANLLDMSRIATGAINPRDEPIGVEEIVPAALASLGERALGGQVELDVPETLPRVHTDPALLERAIANLVDNALAWSPPDAPVRVQAGQVGTAIAVRVIDRGPGIPVAERANVFLPFQRRGDRSNGPGVGLGLAVARGFIEAVGGRIEVDDTPGGGTTMVVSLPAELAASVPPDVTERAR